MYFLFGLRKCIKYFSTYMCVQQPSKYITYESQHNISNNVVCATSKGSDLPAQMRSPIRAFPSRLNILWLLSCWPTAFRVSMLMRRLQRLIWVYSCQNATLLEIACRGSYVYTNIIILSLKCKLKSRGCHGFLSVQWSLLVTCWERAGLLALMYFMFYCAFVTFPYGVLIRCGT